VNGGAGNVKAVWARAAPEDAAIAARTAASRPENGLQRRWGVESRVSAGKCGPKTDLLKIAEFLPEGRCCVFHDGGVAP
jgi:hypothetical protein